MLKVWILVFFPLDDMPLEIAAYDTQADCFEVGDSLLVNMTNGNAYACIEGD
jgi:hypothetical protein